MNQLRLFEDYLPEDESNITELKSLVDTELEDFDRDTKVCRICKLEKSLDGFFLDRGKPYSKCKECFRKYSQDLKIVHQNAPAKPEKCQCCNKTPSKWVCDHYPNSTTFRGWVCWECNNAAGSVGDSYEGAVMLLNYLYRTKK